ncbi:MAG TPA: hypothetical protein VIU61_16070 [Kofleriaceae bacterium]
MTRAALIVLVCAACGGPGGRAGEATFTFGDVSEAQVPSGEVAWTGVLAYGFGGTSGEILESALVGVMPDPCDVKFDLRFEGEPTTETFAIDLRTTILIRRGGGTMCPSEPEMLWGATAGELAITLEGNLVTASFSDIAMAPATIPGMTSNAAMGMFLLSGSAAALDYR